MVVVVVVVKERIAATRHQCGTILEIGNNVNQSQALSCGGGGRRSPVEARSSVPGVPGITFREATSNLEVQHDGSLQDGEDITCTMSWKLAA